MCCTSFTTLRRNIPRGWENLNDIEIFHRNFLRNLLKTFKFTPNCTLYGETGSFNTSTKIKTRMINFWLNLKFWNPGTISSSLFGLTSKLHTEKHDTFHFKWVETVKSTLDNIGFSSIWQNQYIDVAKFKSCLVQGCKYIFQQKWVEKVSNNSECTFYRKVKDSFNMEDYLVNLESCDKYNLIKFRTRTYHLPKTKQRFHDTSADIACPLCSSNEVGDEFYYWFVCDFFQSPTWQIYPCRLAKTSTYNYVKKSVYEEWNHNKIWYYNNIYATCGNCLWQVISRKILNQLVNSHIILLMYDHTKI